jgi:hypothetical protein
VKFTEDFNDLKKNAKDLKKEKRKNFESDPNLKINWKK